MPRSIITERDVDAALREVEVHPAGGEPEIASADPPLGRSHALPGAGPGANVSLVLRGMASGPDDYVTRLLKYVPAEVVALYVTLHGVVSASRPDPDTAGGALVFVFVACLLLTPVYLWRLAGVRRGIHLLISTGAFIVWALAVGSPFEIDELWPALLLPLYTVGAALVKP